LKPVTKVCRLLIALAVLFLFSCAPPAGTAVVLDPSYYTDKYDYDNSDTFLGRAINMGNFLEAPKTAEYELGEGSWSGGRLILQSDFTAIKAAGFSSVRLPIRWSDHASTDGPDYAIDSAFLNRVKDVVGWALGAGLRVVMNCHHYNEMFDPLNSTLAYHEARLAAIWSRICDEFPSSSYGPDKVVFELLNEPNGRVGYAEWNDIIEDLTKVIWTDHSTTQAGRKIMVGTANWGGVPGLQNLELPEACTAENTIITIHYYEPFHFTHQGAEWVSGSDAWIGTAWTGCAADQQPLLDLLNAVTSWDSVNGRGFEIFMGEFGAYTKYVNPEYQKAWTAFIAREAEHRVMSWGYWEFCSGFGAYDPAASCWRPQLLDALIPACDR